MGVGAVPVSSVSAITADPEVVAERQRECGERTGHCLHGGRIGGRVLPPGTQECCMCHAAVLAPALTWEGDGA